MHSSNLRQAFAGLFTVLVGGFVLLAVTVRPVDDAGAPPLSVEPRVAGAVETTVPAVSTSATSTVPAVPTSAVPTTAVGVDDIPQSGAGTFTVAAGGSAGAGVAPFLTYTVEVEDGSGLEADEVAAFVDATLANPRSWIGNGTRGFQRVPTDGDFRIIIATAATVDRLCAPLRTNGIFSCGRNNTVAINLMRWHTATSFWPAGIVEYRHYVVNHEVGHIIGQPHRSCPGAGQTAPVMQQQTKTLDGCSANGWPYSG